MASVALLSTSATGFPGEAPQPPGFDFLYIESNVGTASGGHVALRIGDDVFHYQHAADGFLELARDDWARFRFAYNDRDNRNIHVARLRVTPLEAERIRDRFVHLYLVQRGHLEFLDALRRDAAWLKAFESGRVPVIEGTELFRPGIPTRDDFTALRAQIAMRYDPRYLSREALALEARLASLRYQSPALAALDIAPDRHMAYPDAFSDRYRELASRLVAVRVLAGAWGLDDDALMDAPRGRGCRFECALAARERARLGELARRLEQSTLSLLGSRRADGGSALLLALARLAAVQRSLVQDRLILLNPFHGVVREALPAAASVPASPLIEARARQRLDAVRRAYFALEEPDEASLHVLENAVARYHWRHLEARTGDHRTFPAEPLVPAAGRRVGVATPPGAGFRQAEAAQAGYRLFRDKLRRAYGYNLIGRNCATELMRALNSAFPGDADRRRALGAPIDPNEGFAFIPFRLHEAVSDRVDAPERFVLPSYRNRALATLSARETPLWIHLAESTTATSALYEPRTGDTLFLFFTEDWPWLRPLFGVANLGFGLLNAGGGVLTAAFDDGERLAEGLRGALFSLPELAFFNIRKGSFDVHRLPRADGERGAL